MRMLINDLPDKLLSHVLSYLHPLDRLGSALTCRRWAEVTSQLMDDIRLSIARSELEHATPVLRRTTRSYKNLLLYEVSMDHYHPNFWDAVGGSLRELELRHCTLVPEVLCSILKRCSRLNHLNLHGLSTISNDIFEFAEDTFSKVMRESPVRHLRLDMDLERGSLKFLLELMPNLSKLTIVLNEESGIVDELAACLKAKLNITTVNLVARSPTAEEEIKLIRMCPERLRELELWYSTSGAFSALSELTELRSLSLGPTTGEFKDEHLENVLIKNRKLETLRIDECSSLTEKGFAGIFKLEKLRTLKIGHDSPPEESWRTLMCDLSKILTLQVLDLGYLEVDNGVMRTLASLTELRSFSVRSGALDSQCIRIICQNFKKLEALLIESTGTLEVTDDDWMKFRRLKELRDLSINALLPITDKALEKGIGSRTMTSLSLTAFQLTDVGLAHIAAHHRCLRKLVLSGCWSITIAGISSLLKVEPSLQTLEFHDCISNGDKLLEAVDHLCPRLRLLTLAGAHMSQRAEELFYKLRPDIDLEC